MLTVHMYWPHLFDGVLVDVPQFNAHSTATEEDVLVHLQSRHSVIVEGEQCSQGLLEEGKGMYISMQSIKASYLYGERIYYLR